MKSITIEIRGQALVTSDIWNERDIAALSSVGSEILTRFDAEALAGDAFRTIFPNAPENWTLGGRLRLSMMEILPIVQELLAVYDTPEMEAALATAQEITKVREEEPDTDVLAAMRRVAAKRPPAQGFGATLARVAINAVSPEALSKELVTLTQEKPPEAVPQEVVTDGNLDALAVAQKEIEALRAQLAAKG